MTKPGYRGVNLGIRPKNLRSARKPLDGQTEKILGKLIETYRDALLKQWNDQIQPQQQRDLERS